MTMRFALVDSGLGVLATAAELRRFCPDATLILSMDPDGMPWGHREPDDVTERLRRIALATLRYDPDVLICASNTGSIHALDMLRAELDAVIPVIGTFPLVKPAAATGERMAVWATTATINSAYMAELIVKATSPGQVTLVASLGLAAAVEGGTAELVAAAVTDELARTPQQVRHLVLGCTQYELAAPWITAARPGVKLYGSAREVAAQALRRALCARQPFRAPNGDSGICRGRRLHVLLGGREGSLPRAALTYIEGRIVADGMMQPRTTARRPVPVAHREGSRGHHARVP